MRELSGLLLSSVNCLSAGEHNTALPDGTELILQAQNHLIHPKYKARGFNYDYALLRLRKKIDFRLHPDIR